MIFFGLFVGFFIAGIIWHWAQSPSPKVKATVCAYAFILAVGSYLFLTTTPANNPNLYLIPGTLAGFGLLTAVTVKTQTE